MGNLQRENGQGESKGRTIRNVRGLDVKNRRSLSTRAEGERGRRGKKKDAAKTSEGKKSKEKKGPGAQEKELEREAYAGGNRHF